MSFAYEKLTKGHCSTAYSYSFRLHIPIPLVSQEVWNVHSDPPDPSELTSFSWETKGIPEPLAFSYWKSGALALSIVCIHRTPPFHCDDKYPKKWQWSHRVLPMPYARGRQKPKGEGLPLVLIYQRCMRQDFPYQLDSENWQVHRWQILVDRLCLF